MKSLKADIFFDLFGVDLGAALAGLDGLAFLVEHDAGFIEHPFVGEDRHLGADGQRDGVARAGVNFVEAAIYVKYDAGVEGVVREVVHQHVVHDGAEMSMTERSRSWVRGRATATS